MVITNPKMKTFVESPISNDFGLTVDEVSQKCRNYGRFSAWLNGDVSRIKEVLNAVKNVGVSPAFFAAYERTEGYNASWGWLNHTSVNGSPLNDAKTVAQWVVNQSKNTSDKPAWIDFANYKDFVPNNIKQEGNAHFSTLPSGVIGKVVIAGTAAATWEVYYPNGLLAEYNGVQNYGTPINHMIQYIEEWGGTISGSGGGDSDGRQLAVLPIDYVHVTQGEYGSFSHFEGSGQELAIDFIFPHNQYPAKAPFDIEVMDRRDNYATVVWKNTKPVMGANGVKYDELHIIVIHDWNFKDYNIGDTRKKGEVFFHSGSETGGGGVSTGDHLHLEVMKGHTYQFPPPSSNQLHIYEVFDTKHVKTWVDKGGYTWLESDYVDGVDGDDGGTPDETENKDDIIPLLMVNALNGWYN